MKLWRFIVALLLICCQVLAADSIDNTRAWMSMSSLWGQGGLGASYRTTNATYCVTDFFNYDWGTSEFSYNEVELLKKHGKYFEGVRFRYQAQDNEAAPFIGRHDYFGKKTVYVPFSIHNEIEWRESPYNRDSYLRTQHGLTLFSPETFFDKNELTPFVGIVSYYDWDNTEIEKTRVYVGYSMKVDHYHFSLYYIPWRDGAQEKEWDDQRDFGASIQYHF